MKIAILILTLFLTSCNSSDPKTDSDNSVPDKDSATDIDKDKEQPDEQHDIDTDTDISPDIDDLPDTVDEVPDVDMYCPYPMDAKYPYYRQDGTIHFCRPCDTPDEYDPQCVKSLWKDLNKEVYDKYKNGEFEDNEYIAECYPWPCEWNVVPTPNDQVPLSVHRKCDLFLNPRTWAASFRGSRRESNMENGKIVFWVYNYRIADKKLVSDGYNGQRAVMYDIETGKYKVLGKSGLPAYMNGSTIMNVFFSDSKNQKTYRWVALAEPFQESFKYSLIYSNENNDAYLEVFPHMTEKWTIMVINNMDDETDPVGAGNRSLVYAKTGEWKWTTLAYGYPDGKAGELSIAGDKAMFAHIATNTSYICDLSKNPKSISDCKKISRDGEVAGFPKFDRDNPNRIVYRSMGEGKPTNRFVAVDISKEPWVIEKEFEIPSTEGTFLSMWLTEVRSNLLLYHENYVLKASGYQEDGKLCFYRMDKEKVYCSKPIEGQTDYGHGFPAMEGKYLFWQPAFKTGYILRDMECYCKEAGVCPFEE